MSTTTVKTIGATGADYSTLQAWEDAAAANLTTSIAGGEIWQGQIKDATDAFSAATTLLLISGSTTDATGYKELTTAAGASFKDHASASTNRLYFDTSKGCSITSTGTNVPAVKMDENYCRVNNVLIANTSSGGVALATNAVARTNMDVNSVIVEAQGNSGVGGGSFSGYGGKVRNSLFIFRGSGVTSLYSVGSATVDFINCTFVVPSDKTAATNCFFGNYGTVTTKNCAIFGHTNIKTGTSGYTHTTGMTDVASPGAGFTTVTYANQFQDIVDATRDFRLKTGADCIDAGTTDSTNAANDIIGTARPSGGGYDVGAWEFVAGAITLTGSASTSAAGTQAPGISVPL